MVLMVPPENVMFPPIAGIAVEPAVTVAMRKSAVEGKEAGLLIVEGEASPSVIPSEGAQPKDAAVDPVVTVPAQPIVGKAVIEDTALYWRQQRPSPLKPARLRSSIGGRGGQIRRMMCLGFRRSLWRPELMALMCQRSSQHLWELLTRPYSAFGPLCKRWGSR